jgi:hypothetical protein
MQSLERAGELQLRHRGSLGGCSGVALLAPERGLAGVMLANLDSVAGRLGPLLRHEMGAGAHPPGAHAPSRDGHDGEAESPAASRELAGSYACADLREARVVWTGGDLRLRLGFERSSVLRADGPDAFVHVGGLFAGEPLTFRRAGGRVLGFDTGGMYFERVAGPPATARPRAARAE